MMPTLVNDQVILSLGPFQGITDVYYRLLFNRYFGGIDKYYTPFFTGIYKANSRSIRSHEIDTELNDINTLTPQILSRDTNEIILFGQECLKLGYKEINLNLGCPYPRVAKKKRGSGLLAYPELMADILDELKQHLPVSLSIKCRLGYIDSHEIDALIPLFNNYGISELIVHARIGKQLYQGAVHEDRFAQLIPLVQAVLFYNGDVFSKKCLVHFQKKYPSIRHWMLGRGLLADPFLALDIKGVCGLTPEERKNTVSRFMVDLYLQRRKNAADSLTSLGRMKELWSYMAWSVSDPLKAWRLIRKCTDFDSYESAVAEVFETFDWLGEGYHRKGLVSP